MPVLAPIGWHVTLRLDRDFDRVIATTMSQIRNACRLFLRLGRRADLLAFGIADTHMHALLACDRSRAGRFVHDVEVGLRHRLELPVPFARARFTPVERQGHLRNTIGYVFGQDDHHALHRDPFREGTNLCDLLGARTFGRWTVQRFKELLPRVGRGDLLEHLPWASALIIPAPPDSWICSGRRWRPSASSMTVGASSRRWWRPAPPRSTWGCAIGRPAGWRRCWGSAPPPCTGSASGRRTRGWSGRCSCS